MHLVAILLLALGATALARIPTDLSFVELTSRYLPLVSLNTAYIANDSLASRQLANARDNPVTIFLSLDLPFLQFLAEPPQSTAAGQVQQARYEDPRSNTNLLQYSQLDGVHKSMSFNGTSLMTTRLKDGSADRAKMKVIRNATNFYFQAGLDYVSNVLIREIAFANGSGILHINDHPAAPPYSLSDTAIVLDNSALKQATHHFPQLDRVSSGVTIFAIQSSALPLSVLPFAIIIGEVVYSTDLIAGSALSTLAHEFLVIGRDPQGNVLVNGRRVVTSDILTQNGVVHILGRRDGLRQTRSMDGGSSVLMLLLCFIIGGVLWRKWRREDSGQIEHASVSVK